MPESLFTLIPSHRPSGPHRNGPSFLKFHAGLLTALLCASAVAASAQSRGHGGGGGRSGGADRPAQDCASNVAGPASRQQLADLAPPDPLGALHALMGERRPGLNLSPAQAPLFEATLRDLKDLVDINERRFWHVVGTGPVSATPNLERELANEGEEGQDRLAAIRDFLQDWAQLRAGMNDAQRLLIDTAWQDSRAAPTRKGPGASRSRSNGPASGLGSPRRGDAGQGESGFPAPPH